MQQQSKNVSFGQKTSMSQRGCPGSGLLGLWVSNGFVLLSGSSRNASRTIVSHGNSRPCRWIKSGSYLMTVKTQLSTNFRKCSLCIATRRNKILRLRCLPKCHIAQITSCFDRPDRFKKVSVNILTNSWPYHSPCSTNEQNCSTSIAHWSVWSWPRPCHGSKTWRINRSHV